MAFNVHHMNIRVNCQCASSAIGYLRSSGHNVHMAKRVHKKLGKTFMREWREENPAKAKLKLVEVAEHIGLTHGQLSKMERRLQPYNQRVLESLADLYGCTILDLLSRDPSAQERDSDKLSYIFHKIADPQRERALKILEAFIEPDGNDV